MSFIPSIYKVLPKDNNNWKYIYLAEEPTEEFKNQYRVIRQHMPYAYPNQPGVLAHSGIPGQAKYLTPTTSEQRLMMKTIENKAIYTDENPLPTDDISLGYQIGDIWINNGSKVAFVLVDNTTQGSAIWKQLNFGNTLQLTNNGSIHFNYENKNPIGKKIDWIFGQNNSKISTEYGGQSKLSIQVYHDEKYENGTQIQGKNVGINSEPSINENTRLKSSGDTKTGTFLLPNGDFILNSKTGQEQEPSIVFDFENSTYGILKGNENGFDISMDTGGIIVKGKEYKTVRQTLVFDATTEPKFWKIPEGVKKLTIIAIGAGGGGGAGGNGETFHGGSSGSSGHPGEFKTLELTLTNEKFIIFNDIGLGGQGGINDIGGVLASPGSSSTIVYSSSTITPGNEILLLTALPGAGGIQGNDGGVSSAGVSVGRDSKSGTGDNGGVITTYMNLSDSYTTDPLYPRGLGIGSGGKAGNGGAAGANGFQGQNGEPGAVIIIY